MVPSPLVAFSKPRFSNLPPLEAGSSFEDRIGVIADTGNGETAVQVETAAVDDRASLERGVPAAHGYRL